MKNNGLLSITKRRKKYYGPKESNPKGNKINRNFDASCPFDKLATDMSEISKNGKKIYISSVKDLHTHVIEALEIGYSPSLTLAIKTIKKIQEKSIEYGTFFHSDQGSLYNNRQFQKILSDNNFIQSMSRKGNPIDNSPMESFFSTLKSELIYNDCVIIKDDVELIQEIQEYIHYYNYERIQKSLGYLTPMEFKKKELNQMTQF
jgi:transposase InsO family protein